MQSVSLLVLVTCSALLSSPCYAAEEVEEGASPLLTEETFDDAIKEKPYFVMFFAPWCGHCKKLAPVWQELHELIGGFTDAKEGDAEAGAAIDVGVARVDCTKQTALCSKHQVTGYPTLKFFKRTDDSVRYKGARAIDDLVTFIKKEIGLIKEPEEPAVEEAPKVVAPLIYTTETFEKIISTGHHFVKFFAPWCGHCQRLAPIWDKLAEAFGNTGSVTIGKVDCTEQREICTKYGVRGYPTLLWFTDGEQVGEKYAGDRSLDALRTFAVDQANSKPSKPIDEVKAKDEKKEADAAGSDSTPSPPPSQSAVLNLNEDNFQQTIKSGITLIKFFAPWCGHCKRMAGAYEQLGQQFADNAAITVAEVDCTAQGNRELCTGQEVKGFPTILLYRDGARDDSYEGDRSTADMAQFLTGQLQHDEL